MEREGACVRRLFWRRQLIQHLPPSAPCALLVLPQLTSGGSSGYRSLNTTRRWNASPAHSNDQRES